MTTTRISTTQSSLRPSSFASFVGQEEIKKVVQAALTSAQSSEQALGHMLFSGQSGYGKTTMAQLIAQQMNTQIKIITGYAITKPADMVSVLNALGPHDILFIDEIHRLRSSVEEVLYIAMEDYRIDMVMPDGGSVSIPLQPFTLIGATTKMESLTSPLKNRFVYKFHFQEYTTDEQQAIVARYLELQEIHFPDRTVTQHLLPEICAHLTNVPREIANFCIQLRDYLVAHYEADQRILDQAKRKQFWTRSNLQKGGLTQLHQHYLSILDHHDGQPVGLKTIAVKLGMSEKAVEDDIEPLLFKLNKIEKTSRGRILK